MKRHYYIISRGRDHAVMAFESARDIERWLNVEPLDGFTPDLNHSDVDEERALRSRCWMPCGYNEARYWIGTTINYVAVCKKHNDPYTGVMHTLSLY